LSLASIHKPINILLLMRPKQWLKNAYVIAPFLFGSKLNDQFAIFSISFAVLIFSVISSAIYVFNDICDYENDKFHPEKRNRPLASGKITLPEGYLILVILLAFGAFFLHFGNLGNKFSFFVILYISFSFTYSLGLKKVPLIELFIVASGYLFRLLAGSAALQLQPTSWIIVTSFLLSLLIVAGKRRDELHHSNGSNIKRETLRSYNISFLDKLITVLASCTIMTYLMFTTSKYANERFGGEGIAVTAIFVIFGILRYLQIIEKGKGAEDPSELLLNDRWLQITILTWLITFFIFMYI